MMDVEKLIERLKCPQMCNCPMDGEYPSCWACQKDIKRQAATDLEKLQAENERLRSEAEGMRSNWYKSVEEVKKLRTELDEKEKYYDQMIDALAATDNTELEQVKRRIEIVEKQRDAAIEELENYMVQDVLDGNEPCGICAKASNAPCECCDPKWRGPKED